jgi:5-methyltetrahydropteroyltriglutamate--homocysteine methyltransferase
MCYGKFNDIIEAIGNMDADVLAIESARSGLGLLEALVAYRYPNDIGPGIYDVHSPRIPSREELEEALRRILLVVPAQQVWVNPDCGLKIRRWEEIRPALTHLVEAARATRASLGAFFTGQEGK